jgi:hypothetical protein
MGAEVRDGDDPDPGGFQLAQGGGGVGPGLREQVGVGPGLRVQVGVEEAFPLLGGQLKPHGRGGIDQGFLGDPEEVGLTPREGPQEAVLRLLGPPGPGELGALAWERLLDGRADGVGLENDEVIEGCGLQVFERLVPGVR